MRLLPRGWPRAPGKHLKKMMARGRELGSGKKHQRRALVLTEEITPRCWMWSFQVPPSRFPSGRLRAGSGSSLSTLPLAWILCPTQGPPGLVPVDQHKTCVLKRCSCAPPFPAWPFAGPLRCAARDTVQVLKEPKKSIFLRVCLN